MQSVNWQLYIAGEPVKPGVNLRVKEKWQNAAGVYIVVNCADDDKTSTFHVRFNVNIGGKNYLLLEDASTPAGDLTVVRHFSADNLSAMDPDRFSSLRNALIEFLKSALPTKTEELEKLFGGLESR
jgi:hypothetical protein